MTSYELTQRLMSVATYYDVRESGTEDVVFHVKAELMSPRPSCALLDKDENELARLRGNINKTHFTIEANKKELARVDFPVIAFKKKLELTIGDKKYHADAGVLSTLYDFQCKDADGKVAMSVKKAEGFTKVRDRFVVEPGEIAPKEIALLVAVAIHTRYFEMI
jgi:uncharacterized protein YxjI